MGQRALIILLDFQVFAVFFLSLGNKEEPVKYNNSSVYYRGARVLDLVMAYLMKMTGLRVAEKVILCGVSGKHIIILIMAFHMALKSITQ